MAFPDSAVELDLGRGTASYRASDLALGDFRSIPNSLGNGAPSPATVTFDVTWSGVTERGTFSDASSTFALDFVRTGASIRWSGSSALGSFTSTAVTGVNFAQLAHERNGRFFGD